MQESNKKYLKKKNKKLSKLFLKIIGKKNLKLMEIIKKKKKRNESKSRWNKF